MGDKYIERQWEDMGLEEIEEMGDMEEIGMGDQWEVVIEGDHNRGEGRDRRKWWKWREKVEGDRLGTKCAYVYICLRETESVCERVSQELSLCVGIQAETSLWTFVLKRLRTHGFQVEERHNQVVTSLLGDLPWVPWHVSPMPDTWMWEANADAGNAPCRSPGPFWVL